VYALVADSYFFLFLGILNVIFLAMVLSPIPTVDGAVIWREMRHWRR
jgi:hypothetical protein